MKEVKLHTDGDDGEFQNPALLALIEGLAAEGDGVEPTEPQPDQQAPSRFRKFN